MRLHIVLDTYGSVDPFGVFPLFLYMVIDIIAPKPSIIFRWFIRLGSFAECWRSPNVAAIPKVALFLDRENYRPISITPILYKVYEKLVCHKLSSFGGRCFFCLLLSLLSRIDLGRTDALLTINHHLAVVYP